MNPGKRGSSERGNGQKGSDSRRSPAMHERSSGKRSPASSHSPANKCGSIPPLLQNEMNRAAAASFLGNFAGAAGFPPSVWQDLPYLLNLNPLQPSFMPRLPLGLDMFSAPFLHPMPGSAPGLFPPGLPLLRPPGSTAGLLHSPYATMFPNVNDVPVHLLPKPDQTGSRPRSAKKTSSLASSSSESDIVARTGAPPNLSAKHDPKPSHSRKEFWHSPAEMAKVDMRKRLSGSPIVAKSKPDEVVDVMNYSDCNHDSPLELTVKKSSIAPATEVGPPKRSGSAIDELTSHDDVISHSSLELHRVTPCEKYPPILQEDDIECLSLRKTLSDVSLSHADQPNIFSAHSGRNFSDSVLEELKDKADEDRRLSLDTMNEAKDLTKASCSSAGTDFEVSQISGAAPARQNIALPPRKRLTRNPEELGLGVPNQSSGSDSPSSASNFRLYWKKFAAKTNLNGQPSHRAFISGGKPVHDCRTYFQKMAAKEACKSGLLIGKTFIAGKGKGFFHRAVSRSSPRFSRTEGGIPPDGSTSPRVTRSQSKLKQKKSGGSPKSSPSEPPLPVRKSLRKKTANSKYETEDMIMMGGKGSAKKETPPKGGTKSVGKSSDKEMGRSSSKSGDLSDNMDDDDPKRQGKPYSLRDREEKAKGRGGSKGPGKDGVQKPGDQASSGLPQSLQPLLGGSSSKPSEGCLETPERKKGSDDAFDDKGIGSSSKQHTEHDGKSISSGVSTCSADVALDPEILSLPPKFRRSKGKTISTSQSVSSIEDDRSAEGGGVHKDIKVDLCRAFLDHDHSTQSGCGAKSQCSADSAAKPSETPVESSGEELRLESKSSKVVHPNTVEAAEHEELGSLQEQKSAQKLPNVVEVDKKAEAADKKLVIEKNVEPEKKSEVEKAPEPKVEKPNRSTGGKKSLLYRMSLSAAFDESEATAVSKTDATVVAPGVSHRDAFSSSVEKTPSTGKPEEEPATEIDKPNDEADKTCRSQGTLVTKENEKTEESKGANREDAGDGAKLDIVETPQVKSVSEFPGLRGSCHPTAVGGPVSHGPVPHAEPAKSINNEKNSKAHPTMDDPDTSIAFKRQGTPVTRVETEVKTSDVIHDVSHQDVPTSSVAVEVKPKPHVSSQPVEVIASHTKDCASDEGIARTENASSNPVQLSTIVLPSLVQNSDDNSAKSNRSFSEESLRKDEFRSENQQREVTERRLTSEAQRASKKRSLEDTLSIVRNKKLKKGENLERAAKLVVDRTHQQQMSAQVHDAPQDVPAKEQETEVGVVPAGSKSSTINPLHFYSHRKSVLPPPPPLSSSSGLSQTASPIVTTSHSDAGHSETTPSGAKKSKAPPLDVFAPKQSSRSGGRAKPDVVSTDLLSSAVDSEPPILEKTDFTYMEQFSDISDSDEGEHRGPPMLEATSDCGVAKAKPCAGLALDKHILFAKIASSALEKGGTSSGSRPEERDTGDAAKEIVPNCGSLVNLTSLIGNASHLPVHQPVSSSSTSLPVSHSPAPSSGNRPSAPPATASHSLPPSASPVNSVTRSLSPGPVHQSPAPPTPGRQRKSATRKNKSAAKDAKQQSSSAAAEERAPAPSPSPAEFSSKDLPICKEGIRYSNSTLSADDLESCGIVAPLLGDAKETVTKKKTLLKSKDTSHLATSDVKKPSDFSSLLQHCKSFSVVVQKIDEKGRKRQRRTNPVLKPDTINEDLDVDVHAVKETADAKLKTSLEDRKEATRERRVTGPLNANTNRAPAVGRPAKVVGEKPVSRKQKPKARKEMDKVAEAREKSTAKSESRIEKDEGKAETKDESLKLSVYDFDKDSNDEVDFETPLGSSRKQSSKKKLRPLDESTKSRRPIRLKLHVAEQSPVLASTTRGRLLGNDEKPESKALKEVQPSTPHSEKSVDSNEKLAVGPTDASIGHVKCRLVKVGRHQWMSVGDANPQESSSRGGASDARSTSSTHDGLDVDEILPEIKIPKVTRKTKTKELPGKNDGAVTVKAGRGRPRTRNEPKKKPGKRAARAKAAAEDFSVSDNSVPSIMSRAQQSSGALSPNSVMDQASRCSESESVAISLAGQSSNSNDYKIPDFLDLLFGDDLQGFVLDEVSETKVVDVEVITRCAIERANFSNIYDSELDDYRETLSPASTFFVPSEIETQLAKMTLSDHPHDFNGDASSTLLSPSRQLAAVVQPDVWDTVSVSPAPRDLAECDFTPQENKENHLEVDRLLTQTLTNTDDGDDCLKNQFGDELMEEFVSWMSPKWDDMSPHHDLEDPLNSLNLFSPFIDSPKTRQKLYI